jgi:EAL domain-containing protein (putative c-di-GMP-specific phosphodiesterase class I)
MSAEGSVPSRALLVDDDEPLLRIHARALEKSGYQVETAANGTEAIRALGSASYDVILSDIDMPEMNGLTLLERVRSHDLDVPVILITGAPSVESAAIAMEHGALRYLTKPINLSTLTEVANDAVRLHRIAKAKRQALDLAGGVDYLIGDQAGRMASLGRAMESLHIAYQPIVSWRDRRVFAYEALLRSREPMLPNPGAIIDAAEKLDRVHDLGRRIRAKAIEPLASASEAVSLFINLHPHDLLDAELFRKDGAFAAFAERIVLEITERASLDDIGGVRPKVMALRNLGFRIALDDLGAGYAGLTSFTLLEPDVVKLDMSLVRDLDKSTTKRKLVRTITSMCGELGIIVTSEGIETAGERDELARAGCDLMQGYLFAKPGEPFPSPSY